MQFAFAIADSVGTQGRGTINSKTDAQERT
jgi:hypothetical protein